MENKILDALFKGDFKTFKEDVTSSLFQKIGNRLEDAKAEIAKSIFGEDSEDSSYKERINHSDKDGYPEGREESEDDEDDQKGGEFLVHVKMLEVPDTELENFRVVGTSKADIESKLEKFFGKGKYEVKSIKLSESTISKDSKEKSEKTGYFEKDWQKKAKERKEAKEKKDEEDLKKQDPNSIWSVKNESTIVKTSPDKTGYAEKDWQKEAKEKKEAKKKKDEEDLKNQDPNSIWSVKNESINTLQGLAAIAQSVNENSTIKTEKKETEATIHESFTDALDAAKKHALGSGYKHNLEEFDDITTKGFIKPSEKTSHVFHVNLLHEKDGKEVINKVHNFQITGHGDGKFSMVQDII